jgi:hypothetical protein
MIGFEGAFHYCCILNKSNSTAKGFNRSATEEENE